jgi:hypothetical protein
MVVDNPTVELNKIIKISFEMKFVVREKEAKQRLRVRKRDAGVQPASPESLHHTFITTWVHGPANKKKM